MNELVALQRTLYTSSNPTRRWLHTSRRDRIVEALATAPVVANERALEVGPGSGVYLPALCRRFARVVAADIEPAHVEALQETARSLPNLQLITRDIAASRWERKFDLVLCSEVIEHVRDPAALAAGIAEALGPGGILVLSTPQPFSIMELTAAIALRQPFIGLTRHIYREPVLPTGHISVMANRRVIALLRDNAFEVLHSEYFGLYLPIIAELGGELGAGLLRRADAFVRAHGPRGILWTQLHVARKR